MTFDIFVSGVVPSVFIQFNEYVCILYLSVLEYRNILLIITLSDRYDVYSMKCVHSM